MTQKEIIWVFCVDKTTDEHLLELNPSPVFGVKERR